MSAVLWALLVASGNLLGGAVILSDLARRRGPLALLVAFGAGFMLALAVLEMLPAALEVEGGLTAVLLGYLGVHLTQHALVPHFHFGEERHAEAMISPGVGVLAVTGMVPHAFFDGVAIASGLLVSPSLGMLIVVAVLLHKIPAGVSLASIMVASGNSASRAMLAVTGVALATVLGALATPWSGLLVRYGLGLAAGVTLYVAASDLMPEVQRQEGWLVPTGVFLGVAGFFLARSLLPA